MDANRFDDFTRGLGTLTTRRAALRAAAGGLLAALGMSKSATATVAQARCDNKRCKSDPGRCGDGCVCCVYGNGNSRCRPPGTCGPGTEVGPPPTCPVGQRFCPGLGACAACCADPDCDDRNPCTVNTCVGSVCRSSPAVCDDGDRCTTSTCDPIVGCVHAPLDCDDGDPCTVDNCDPAAGGCVHRSCEEISLPCTILTCQPGVGCSGIDRAGVCLNGPGFCCRGDGTACQECCDAQNCPLNLDCSDHCAGRACVGGRCQACTADAECDDGDPCTFGTCDVATGLCVHRPCSELVFGPCTRGFCNPGVGCASIDRAGICLNGPGFCCRGDGTACRECCTAENCPIGFDCSGHCPATETCVDGVCQ